MFFNSLDFALFFPLVFALYWFVANKNITKQNLLVVLASYMFYGWWDWRFLALIIISTIVDYLVGQGLLKQGNLSRRKVLLGLSIFVNLGMLGFFKYYNFFVDNFIESFSFFGGEIKPNTLNIILPVGISFYTFQTLSYTIDVYRGKIYPTTHIIDFAAFVSFFPQLVAGPIERAKNLLPQFSKPRVFDYHKAIDGLKQILWGLFKKIVIADNCAMIANEVFNNSGDYSGSTLVLGALFFAFQIYGDFSGYSDIAIGTAKLFGIKLMQNFAFPYFSRDIAEFWRRWHISLSTWFRDYVYIPLGGSRGNNLLKARNVFIIFVVSGFWHGANWTFIIWGALNSLYFMPLLLTGKHRGNMDIVAHGMSFPTRKEFLSMAFTFALVVLAWIFFRADNLSHALNYLSAIFSESLFTIPDFPKRKHALLTILLLIIFLVIEWIGKEEQYAIAKIGNQLKRPFRLAFYYVIIMTIFWLNGKEQEFIYFQF
jgi:D-alanyl-lipoteichoic acid acyltransferase DltB (MBOAT superfamily)